jgi:predicted RNA-binding Zn-ribbon protein involved in translation (DUF1610 family)
MKLTTKSKNRIQICPQCGSPNIETDFSNAAGVIRGFFNTIKCKNCGHEGTFFPTVNIKELKKPLNPKKARNVQHFDKTFSKGIFKTELLVFIIMLTIAGLTLIVYNKTFYSIFLLSIAIILLIIYFLTKSKK